MFAFILFILLAAAGLITIGLGASGIAGRAREADRFGRSGRPSYRGWYVLGGVASVVLSLIILFAASVNTVANRSLGLPVSFGKVGAALNPGFHLLWPWVSVAEISKTVHTIQFGSSQIAVSSAPGNISGPSLTVRIGGQQTAGLDITVAYQVTDAGAPVLYQDYNGQGPDIMDTIARNLIVREEERVVNNVLGDYNPILDAQLSRGVTASSQFSTFAPQVEAQLQSSLGNLVVIKSVLMPLAHYGAETEANLQRIQQQVGQTAIAGEQILTNQKQAQANAAIASSLTHDPGVLVFQCLQIAEAALKAGDTTVQPGFCFGGNFQVATGK